MVQERITVSDEMIAFVGWADSPTAPELGDVVALIFTPTDGHGATVEFAGRARADAPLTFLVTRAACRRLFPSVDLGAGRWHLPVDLRTIAVAVRDGARTPAGITLRLAKCIELFCGVMTALEEDRLVPADGVGDLNEQDARRLMLACRIIDERWREKPTLDAIARACGLNRGKLTRGYRQMFRCSVAEALAERRLHGAHALLLASDLPVSSVGHACGYMSNASFTRAFSRRFGMPPTTLRHRRADAGLAA